MAEKQLLDLPNELLLFIFQYLSAIELITTFSSLQSSRIQALLGPFISFLDISEENDEWIETYLPDALTQRQIVHLRLKDKQIRFVSRYLSSSDIHSMNVISLGLNSELSDDDRVELRQCLKKLYITIDCRMKKEKLIKELFPNNSNAEYFSSTGCFIYPVNDQIYSFPQLTHLSIGVPTIRDVFILLHRLPNLQDLRVDLQDEFSYYVKLTNVENAIPCKTLHRVTFTGETKYFHQFNKFFAAFGSTIESLTLDILINFDRPNGSDLEHDLLDKMPLLSSFDFLINWRLVNRNSDVVSTIDIQTFQSVTWQKFNPVVYWNDIDDSSGGICSLPYKFNYFSIDSNDFASSCAINRPVPVCFEHVRTLGMYSRSPWWNMETFKFIQNAFPNIKTLALTCQLDEIFWNYYVCFTEKIRPEIFSDDFLTNTVLQLPSVTKVCLNIEYFQYNNVTLRCLFHLLPNLITIETKNMERARRHLESRGHYYDDFVTNTLTRIKLKPLKIPDHPDEYLKSYSNFNERDY